MMDGLNDLVWFDFGHHAKTTLGMLVIPVDALCVHDLTLFFVVPEKKVDLNVDACVI